MNVLRSLARDLVQFLQADRSVASEGKSLQPLGQQKAAPVVGLARFRDAFEQLPQGLGGTMRALQAERVFLQRAPFVSPMRLASGDGFEAQRRAPVDLSGGVQVNSSSVSPDVAPTASPSPAAGFSASLDDLLLP
jgi:hypothetical protein